MKKMIVAGLLALTLAVTPGVAFGDRKSVV